MQRNALMIGGFVVVAFLIVIASVFWLSGSDLFSQQQKATVFYEDNVSGLSVGAPVTFRGVSIGQVMEIGILVDGASLRTTVPGAASAWLVSTTWARQTLTFSLPDRP